MTNYEKLKLLLARLSAFHNVSFVLSGFAQHLASHFGLSFSNHSYRYTFSNDRPSDRSPGAEKHMDVRERPLDRSPGAEKHMDVRERPNCFASYSANSGSFMQYAG